MFKTDLTDLNTRNCKSSESIEEVSEYMSMIMIMSSSKYVREVSADTAERAGASFLERVQMCLEHGGAHFEHINKLKSRI